MLAIQDTTDLDFSSLKQTSGLGYINQSQQQGIKVHSCFAVSGGGEPLGLLHQHTWSRAERQGKRGERRKKAICDKESQRWLDTLVAAEGGVDQSMCIAHVGDREADIFDLFMQPRRIGWRGIPQSQCAIQTVAGQDVPVWTKGNRPDGIAMALRAGGTTVSVMRAES